MAPSVNFVSDPSFFPLTLTFSLSHHRETDRGRNFSTLTQCTLQLGLLRAREGDTAQRCPEEGWGWTFCHCYLLRESGAKRKLFGLIITPMATITLRAIIS